MKNKTKKITIGMFYGFKILLEVPKENLEDEWFIERWKEWLEDQKKSAVEEYNSGLFMQEPDKNKSLFNRLFK